MKKKAEFLHWIFISPQGAFWLVSISRINSVSKKSTCLGWKLSYSKRLSTLVEANQASPTVRVGTCALPHVESTQAAKNIRRNIRDEQIIHRRHGALCSTKRMRLKSLARCAGCWFVTANEESDDEEEEEKLETITMSTPAFVHGISRDRTVLPMSGHRENPVSIGDVKGESSAWWAKFSSRDLFRCWTFRCANSREILYSFGETDTVLKPWNPLIS